MPTLLPPATSATLTLSPHQSLEILLTHEFMPVHDVTVARLHRNREVVDHRRILRRPQPAPIQGAAVARILRSREAISPRHVPPRLQPMPTRNAIVVPISPLGCPTLADLRSLAATATQAPLLRLYVANLQHQKSQHPCSPRPDTQLLPCRYPCRDPTLSEPTPPLLASLQCLTASFVPPDAPR
ncbi:hypothetical protein ACJRO7_020347 [Eucalyptus globulus]|uniref:Uncharacterized protein n=1 Tax=Eucalyptus globulus TaxID=34317 RepID=A0ABD3KSY5_EUCGL